ncbi:MAG: insulinase family protein [Nitrospirota bacterium]|nr:MAG: insulinase family protein [Nitrospirota bacterium]
MFQKTYLDNGIPVIYERTEGFRSVVLGIWVKSGSRHESDELSGISHFIEHMFFKGTGRRSTEDIAKEADAMGADLNAFTSRENTTYYIKVLDDFIDNGIDLLSDLFVNSTFDPAEIEKEKGIVEEEIRMSEDTPDDHVFDLFNEGIWKASGLGRSILGTFTSLGNITRDHIIRHIEGVYNIGNIVISLAGNIDAEGIVKMLNEKLTGISTVKAKTRLETPEFNPYTGLYRKDLSEVHICLGFRGIPNNSPERYAMLLLNTILGSGVSSRLFQEVREKRGLVYSIHSFLSLYHDTGCFGIYAGAGQQKYKEVIDLSIKESCKLKDTVTDDELRRAKDQLKGNILLALESTSARMNNLAKQEIYYGRNYTPQEIIEELEKVSMDEIRSLCGRVFDRDRMAITLLGPVEEGFSI